MFIIFGFNKETVKEKGWSQPLQCPQCRRIDPQHLAEITRWFTLFFIPVIPYSKLRLCACPSCGYSVKVEREQFEQMTAASGSAPAPTSQVGIIRVTCPNSLCGAELDFPAGTMGIVQCHACQAQFDLGLAVSSEGDPTPT